MRNRKAEEYNTAVSLSAAADPCDGVADGKPYRMSLAREKIHTQNSNAISTERVIPITPLSGWKFLSWATVSGGTVPVEDGGPPTARDAHTRSRVTATDHHQFHKGRQEENKSKRNEFNRHT